jgi:neutral ceramidase
MYQAGWGRQEIAIEAKGYAMFGYGMWHHRAKGRQTPLHARAFVIREEGGRPLIFCCLDLGYISQAVRAGVCAALRERFGAEFDEAALVLTCTHTHSGPGGCSHEALYNVVTPGFVVEHYREIVRAAVEAIVNARQALAPTEIALAQGGFEEQTPVAWNRSLEAYNRNPDVVKRVDAERHLALNRNMHVLTFRRQGRVHGLISLFGVHATCLGNTLERHDADNKGYAARHAEQMLREGGAEDAVAIFAQATAGDVSPHYHGAGDWARRKKIKGDDEYAYAERNGRHQSTLALGLLDAAQETRLDGSVDAIFSYADFTAIKADPRFANGEPEACTSEPCHGVAFFTGTPVDGRGMPYIAGTLARGVARAVKKKRLKNIEQYSPEDQAYYRRLYAAQGPKDILLEAGRKNILGQALEKFALPAFVDPTIGELKRQVRIGAIKNSPLVPTVLPLQIIAIGPLALVCCPGEFTTTAGARLMVAVRERLQARGMQQVLICTYCNDYMGYVTTNEEYQQQAYEGGHTIFGQWTLAAFQTRFTALADEMLKAEADRKHDRATRPSPVPADELAKRTNIPVPG